MTGVASAVASKVADSRAFRVLVAPGLLVVFCGALLPLTGVNAAEAVRVLIVVVLQAAAGVVVWRLVRGAHPVPAAEAIGMGLSLGTLMSLLSAQMLLPTPLATFGWIAPLVVVLACLVHPNIRRRFRSGTTEPVGSDEALACGLGFLAALPFLWSFWRAHPLGWDGWWGYYVDIPYHEALSVSLSTWGPGDNILEAGTPIRYHWFTHAWAGLTTNASSAGSFVVITRVLPIVAIVGMVCLAWAWARRLSPLVSVPYLAVALVVLGADIATNPPSGLMQVFGLSPSMSLSAMWLLAFALSFTEHLSGQLNRLWPVLFLLAVAGVGGKTSNAAVIVGGVGLVAVVTLLTPRSRRRAWTDFAVVMVATALAFLALVAGSEGNLKRGFGASAQAYGFLPVRTHRSIIEGTIAVALAITAKWAGVAILVVKRSTRSQPAVWFAVGAAVTGLFLMAVLTHPGSSQLYFPLSAAIVIAVISAWGVGEALALLAPRPAAICAVAGGAACLLGLAYLGGEQPGERWHATVVVWALPVGLAVVLLLARSGRRHPLTAAAGVMGICLVTSGLTSGFLAASDTVRAAPPIAPAPNTALAFSDEQRRALVWLRNHSDRGDIVATNRQCSAPQIGDQPCAQARWFLTAALAHRRMYIEGADYAAESIPPPPEVTERIAVSRRFVDAPSGGDSRTLWRAGVRWVVVDLASTTTRNWVPFATVAHSSPTTDVLRLKRRELP